MAVWLAALSWVADSRWRRLPSGAHLEALVAWLEALELRVVALRLAQPEDFALEAGSPGGRRLCNWLSGALYAICTLEAAEEAMSSCACHAGAGSKVLSGAADRLKSMRQRFSSSSASAGAEEGGTGQPLLPSGGEGGEEQLGQKLKSGFRSLLGKSGKEGAPSQPGESAALLAAVFHCTSVGACIDS